LGGFFLGGGGGGGGGAGRIRLYAGRWIISREAI